MDDTQSSVSWDQVSQANTHQPGEYLVVVPEGGDRISQVTSKYSGGDIIITTPICLYEFGYFICFFILISFIS